MNRIDSALEAYQSLNNGRVEKSWGYEQVFENDKYCMKALVYTKPIASSLHYHQRKTESFYIASGRFEIEIGKRFSKALPGDFFHIPIGTAHRLRCIEPGTVIEASTRDDPEDCIRLIPSEA